MLTQVSVVSICPHGALRWIDEHLPHSWAQFFPKYWAFNINWHERPLKRIGSYVEPMGRWR